MERDRGAEAPQTYRSPAPIPQRAPLTPVERVRFGLGGFEAVERDEKWSKFARYVHRRWPLPASIGVEDIRQEILLEAWLRLQRPDDNPALTPEADAERRRKVFDAARAKAGEHHRDETPDALDRYARWHGVIEGKRTCHRARKAKRHRQDWKQPSRHEMAISTLAKDGETTEEVEHRIYTRLADEHTAPSHLERVGVALSLSLVAEDDVEAAVTAMLVEAGGDPDGAAALLYANKELRYRLWLSCEDTAERLVVKTLINMAGRLAENGGLDGQ